MENGHEIRQKTALDAVITTPRKIGLTCVLGVTGLLAIVAWSESRSAALFTTMSLEHAVRLEAREDAHVREFRTAVRDVNASEARIAWCAAGVLLLSFAAITTLWLPSRQPEPRPDAATTAG